MHYEIDNQANRCETIFDTRNSVKLKTPTIKDRNMWKGIISATHRYPSDFGDKMNFTRRYSCTAVKET